MDKYIFKNYICFIEVQYNFPGIVSEVASPSAPIISYLYRPSSRDDRFWTFPESADLHATPVEQILTSNFCTRYECVSIIKCILDSEELSKINLLFKSYIERQ